MGEDKDIVLYQKAKLSGSAPGTYLPTSIPAPRIVLDAGDAAQFAWDEFFQGELANAYTRRNYGYAIQRFLAWCEEHGLELARITPGHVGSYFQQLPLAVPTKKLHLAAIRKFWHRAANELHLRALRELRDRVSEA